jgi:hypothetical protein
MSDLSNLLGSVYDSHNPDSRPVPQEPGATQRVDTDVDQALSAAIGQAVPAPAPPPVSTPAPEYAAAPAPPPVYVPAPMAGWRLGDDDIVPGVAAKRSNKR